MLIMIRNLTVTPIRTVVLQRSWYQMPGCSVQRRMNKNTHGYITVWYTKQGLNFLPKVHWSRTSEHHKSTGRGGGGGGFFVANSGYFTVFTPHIYFIILISMITDNLVEIRLPKIQSRKYLRKSNLWRYSRKCLRKFNFKEIRSPELSPYHLPQPKEFFPSTMFEMFSSVSLSYL
jgi:hypothetical protein